MAEYLSPAVYIEEIPSGIKPIEGVGTSTGAFVGHAEKGPIGEAVLINNFSEFLRDFGAYLDNGYLAFAVKGFFDEGGKSCYMVRTCHYDQGKPTAKSSAKEFKTPPPSPKDSIGVEAHSPGTWGDDISLQIKHGTAENPADPELFRLSIRYKGNEVETYDNLTMDNKKNDYIETRINGISRYITVEDKVPSPAPTDPRPAVTTAPVPLQGGKDGLTGLVSSDYVGEESLGNGLRAFDKIDGINIVAIPDAVDRAVHVGGMTYCERRGDCFYVADSQELIDTADSVLNYKFGQGVYSGENAINSKYGSLYAPWIYTFDSRTGGRIKIPPSGAVAGRYANTDGARGVHKPPAGIDDGRLRSVLGVDKEFTDADQEKLNPKGVNVIRKINGVGSVIWGARMVSSDPEWKYLNVRRLFLFLEESIESNTKWVVFEPNDKSLWKSIVRNISVFLRLQWLNGALVGNTEEQAFYVKCDEETNPQESIDLGRVVTEIGVAPSKPAEFVIFRIAQWAGGSEVTE